MNYYKYSFSVDASQREILLAFLGELAFESFVETDLGLDAFVPEKEDVNIESTQLQHIEQFVPFQLEKVFIPYQNWNAVWESNFQAIQVDNFCGIRADFHPPFEQVEHELLINPKMAFGTGHHETTFMMIQMMQELDFKNKKVLDYGCGTGILAILASMLQAKHIDAVDIEEPSYHNTIENAELNQVSNITSLLGTIEAIEDSDYDIILANINRHVILDSLEILHQKLIPNGVILFSGILKKDESILLDALKENSFKLLYQIQKGNWLCLKVRAK